MFQCLGLGSVESGGCGEDWYHPECLVGLERDWYKPEVNGNASKAQEQEEEGETSHPLPPGFPGEDDFEHLLCYKCVESNPWIKRYAGTPGFLKPVSRKEGSSSLEVETVDETPLSANAATSLKRKASDDDGLDEGAHSRPKRVKDDTDVGGNEMTTSADAPEKEAKPVHKHDALPPAPSGVFSLFLQADFREHLCHCPACYPNLIPHLQLIEEEETYEPSVSEGSEDPAGSGPRSQGTAASLLDRGEAALSNMDRVRAIEGVMVYNQLRDKVKAFLRPYAESGQAVSAEDIKAYFEKLRGDELAIREARAKPGDESPRGGGGDDSNRREQSGY
jgi:E3 ubiquitin-protein ligase UBR7